MEENFMLKLVVGPTIYHKKKKIYIYFTVDFIRTVYIMKNSFFFVAMDGFS
jgi:hypothetical protein